MVITEYHCEQWCVCELLFYEVQILWVFTKKPPHTSQKQFQDSVVLFENVF